MPSIYFDHNATTPLQPDIFQAMAEVWQLPANASSVHAFGRRARHYVETARQHILSGLNASDTRLIFTSSGTEANHLALHGIAAEHRIISATEHASVSKSADNAIVLPVDKKGIVRLDVLGQLLQQLSGKILISVMLANNETGILQPVHEVVAVARRYGALVHSDAVQASGKVPVDMDALGVDMLTVSAHKIGGPQGAAALLVKKSVPLHGVIRGGGQEQGYRAGTEAVAAIYGFGIAVSQLNQYLAGQHHVRALRDNLEKRIAMVAPEAEFFGQRVGRLPNTSCFTMPGVAQDTQLIHFDMERIAVSAGAACSSGTVKPSSVLLTMGVEENVAATAIRVSLGLHNTMAEIERFITAWQQLYARAGGAVKIKAA